MPIQSQSDMLAAIQAKQSGQCYFNKTMPNGTKAGMWIELFSQIGSVPATTWPGTSLQWVGTDDTSGIGFPHGGNVSPLQKYLSFIGIRNSSNVFGFEIVDLQGYYTGISLTSTATQTLTGSPSFRYPNGAGVRMLFTAKTAVGATNGNITYNYTNQDGVSGRTNPCTVSTNSLLTLGSVLHSGTTSASFAPYLPMAGTDTGIQSVQSIKLSASLTSGTGNLLLVRPIFRCYNLNQAEHEYEMLNAIPALPEIADGACLGIIAYYAGTSTGGQVGGSMEMLWA